MLSSCRPSGTCFAFSPGTRTKVRSLRGCAMLACLHLRDHKLTSCVLKLKLRVSQRPHVDQPSCSR